jgi:hypothetical protein
MEKFISHFIKETFPGTEIRSVAFNPKSKKNLLVYKGGTMLKLLIRRLNKAFEIKRAQVFTLTEKRFIKNYLNGLDSLSKLEDEGLIEFLSKKTISKVAASSVSNDVEITDTIEKVIDILDVWSSETYEGRSISTSILINSAGVAINPKLQFEDYIVQDFAKVMSNGFDTVAEIDKKGCLIRHFCPKITDNHTWKSPYRHVNICALTEGNDNVAIILNRHGEIMIFKSNELILARRRGVWLIFSHDTVSKKMTFRSKKFNENLRKAIYSTALDVSFARSGGCVSYYYKSMIKKGMEKLDAKDIFANKDSIKSRSLLPFEEVGFIDIDRRLRQEIVGIDGASIIDSEGRIIAAGAIVKITESTEDGGGRSAAAKMLSEFGVSLKISSDGKITVYKGGKRMFSFA